MILLSTEIITIIIVCSLSGVLVCVGLYFLIEKFFLSKRKCKKMLIDAERKYEYLHALLIGQDAQYIQRLEIISRTNLLYGDIHSTYFRRFKEIRDNQDNLYLEIINELKEILSEKKFKEFKNYYKDNEEILISFEESVNSLDRDLFEIIKPEEEARQKVLYHKERFREVKSKFNSRENDLSYVYDSFQKVFETVDNRFNEYDNLVETANYEDALNMLPSINKVLKVLLVMIDQMPNYINEVNETLPIRINEVKREYLRLMNEGYPLKSFNVEDHLSNIVYAIEEIKSKLKNLKINGVEENISALHKDLDNILESFDQEITSREDFEKRYHDVNNKFLELEKQFIKISNNMNRFKKVYIIDEQHESDFNELTATLNEVSKDKRRLEIYVHSSTKTPYKVLVEKMKDLDSGNEEFETKINNYVAYLGSLKSDCESVFKLIESHYTKVKEYQIIVKNFNNESIISTFSTAFTKIFIALDEINNIIKDVPINVNKMNDSINSLTSITTNLYKSIDELKFYEESAKKSILIANRERNKFADVNVLLGQAENLYFNGDYKKANELTIQALEKISLKEGIKA